MYSIIVPIYRNELNIPPLLDALEGLNKELPPGEGLEVVFVVDGSPDNSFLLLRDNLPKARFQSQLISLSRNFGAFAAIRAGLESARGNQIAVMAADLQEPPSLLLDMYSGLKSGECEVAYGRRVNRNDPWITNKLSQAFWGFYRKFISKDIPRGGIDIFAVTDRVRDHVLTLNERNSSLIALLFWVGFRRKGYDYERKQREIGNSAWTFAKRWRYMQDSIFSFSNLPISILIFVGVFGFMLSALLAAIVFISALSGTIEVPGYAATILVILMLGMLQILSLGVLGIYIWRVFENTKGRPLHIVMSSESYVPTKQTKNDAS